MLALSAVALLPGAYADGVGASGQCYNGNGSEGGHDEVRVDTNSGLEAGLEPMPGEHGITDALVMFATGTIDDGGNPGSACDRYDCFQTQAQCEANGQDARYDYLEVDASAGAVAVQVCYNGGADLSGSCPKSPPGPGQ